MKLKCIRCDWSALGAFGKVNKLHCSHVSMQVKYVQSSCTLTSACVIDISAVIACLF